MSEFLVIQVGQCGNQIGNAFWPLVLNEYGLNEIPEGININTHNNQLSSNVNRYSSGFHSFFYVPDVTENPPVVTNYQDMKRHKIKARAVLMDMEDSVVNRLRTGSLNNLFTNKFLITNTPGSANNWAEGFYEHGEEFSEKIVDVIQDAVEKCDSLHGFLMLFSVAGGTGSGLGSRTLKILEDNYPLIHRFVCAVYPSGTEDVVTAPYNVTLATDILLKHASCVFPVENRSLIKIVDSLQLNRSRDTTRYLGNCKPFQDMNSIIVNMLLHLTSGARFAGSLNMDMSDIVTNMVPYPQLHYFATSYSPITLSSAKYISSPRRQILENHYNELINRNNQLVELNPLDKEALMIGITLQGRGQLSLSDMNYFINKFQSKAQFTPWSKAAVKLGLCATPPYGHERSLFGIYNTTAMDTLYKNVLNQFHQLYKRKAYVHHYLKIDSFESDHFEMCCETLRNCISYYKNVSNFKPSIKRYYKLY